MTEPKQVDQPSRLYQIKEDDLAELERLLPRLVDLLHPNVWNYSDANRVRTYVRRVQRVLMDVRWGYGPPQEVERIDAG